MKTNCYFEIPPRLISSVFFLWFFLEGVLLLKELLKHHRNNHNPVFLHNPGRMWFIPHSTPYCVFNIINITTDHIYNSIIYSVTYVQTVQQIKIKIPHNISFNIYSCQWFSAPLSLWKIVLENWVEAYPKGKWTSLVCLLFQSPSCPNLPFVWDCAESLHWDSPISATIFP